MAPLMIEPRDRRSGSRTIATTSIMLSDWTDEDPETIVSNLKQQSDYYNYQRAHARHLLVATSGEKGLGATRVGPADVGPDAHEPDRHHGRDRRHLHLPDQRPAAGRQLDGAVHARRESAPALHQRLVDDAPSTCASRACR